MAAPFSFLMDRKENPQLLMKMMVAKSVISSIIVFSDSRRILSEVRMMKQMPKRFEDAFSMCDELFGRFAIIFSHMDVVMCPLHAVFKVNGMLSILISDRKFHG